MLGRLHQNFIENKGFMGIRNNLANKKCGKSSESKLQFVFPPAKRAGKYTA